MKTRLVCSFLFLSTTALAQTPTESPSSAPAPSEPGTEGGASLEAGGSVESEPLVDEASTSSFAAAAPPASESAPGQPEHVPYMKRYKPKAHVLELGFFGGLFFPSAGHQLLSPNQPHQPYDEPAPELGMRVAYYPLAWLGVEGEFTMADGNVPNDLKAVRSDLTSNRANFFAYRGHVIGQLPFWSITPFALVGGGALGVNSQALGRDVDAVFHFGAGVKVPLCENFALRTEFRENLMQRYNDNFGGISFNEEITLGAAFTWGGATKSAPEPIADKDGDHVADDEDVCPNIAALTANGCPPDTDGDGLADPDDECPREAGTTANGCPDPDADQDGVPAPCDQCPDEAGEAPTGCINRDPDGDGIVGEADQCPREPETKNGFEDGDGCPDVVPQEVQSFTGRIEGIQFVIGKATIQKSSEKTLQAAADVLKKYPSIRVEVSGHTSSEGDAAFNQKLSDDRASAVRDWLVRAGVSPDSVSARGAGSSEPVADNATRQGREKNRRIEFRILTQY